MGKCKKVYLITVLLFFIILTVTIFAQSVIKSGLTHSAHFCCFVEFDQTVFPFMYNFREVIWCFDNRSSELHTVGFCSRDSLRLTLAYIFTFILSNK